MWLMFTRPEQRSLFVHWEYWAQQTLALFRASSGRYASERWFIERRDRLMQASQEFRAWWLRYDIAEAQIVHKELHHSLVGLLMLRNTPLLVAEDPNLSFFFWTPLDEDTAQKLSWLVSSAPTDMQVGSAD